MGLILVIGLVHTVISLMMIYRICMGIAEEARIINDNELELKALNRWKVYLIITFSLYVILIIPSLIMLFYVIFIASIINYCLMLGLMSTASNRL